ncbi:MAG TPA: M28 family metallopeptidase [Terriglobales bacterium]|nr:M28 family metallopeptidase [Terriglobales bacterium]
MVRLLIAVLSFLTFLPFTNTQETTPAPQTPTGAAKPAFSPPDKIFGYRDAAHELQAEKTFLAVPDPMMAKQHLQVLTAAPHVAGSPEDRRTAEYVLQQYLAAGLDASIQPYKVWMALPLDIRVDVVAPENVVMHGPSPERVSDDPFQKDPRILPAFNEYSPSGEVTADVVYANYGRADDFKKLEEMGVDVKGKIVIVRYGEIFRGVKVFLAEQHGAAGVIIYSDPIDDGYFKGDKYPKGPWRPDTGVQRGSIQYLFRYPGDPTTPDVASVPELPESKRIKPAEATDLPKIPVTPLSYADATPIMENLDGPESPRAWQGALPFTYHVGPGPVKVHLLVKQNYRFTTIWDVIGIVHGSQLANEWVVTGNHRDAWVYGAVDPNSGTAAQLEAVRGVGALLKTGWRPKRTLVFASWDAEEQGLIGSTEFAEQHAKELSRAVAYFNMDVAVSGPDFGASAVPSLKQYMRDVAKSVPSPKGGSVYDQWKTAREKNEKEPPHPNTSGAADQEPAVVTSKDVHVGDLGSGSDYTAFLQHLGVPSADIGSRGPYGVYHSAFDDFTWFNKFGDPTFIYEQEMARVYGIEAIRMASADVLPYDYEAYGKEIGEYLKSAEQKAKTAFAGQVPSFAEAAKAAERMQKAGANLLQAQGRAIGDPGPLNLVLRNIERDFLIEGGLPNRPWFKHIIYAPGEHTGYAAVVIPGVNEAIEKKDLTLTKQQLEILTAALNRAAEAMEIVK